MLNSHAGFVMQVLPEHRPNLTLGFPARGESFKGLDGAIQAAEILPRHYGTNLHVSAFGANKASLPDWIEWLEFPSQEALRDFYNSRSVFMLPSHFEGWGLTGIEAMACGAALVVTDNGGSRDYAINQKTALVIPPKNPAELAAAVMYLFEKPSVRKAIALAGHEHVRRYTWETAGAKLNALLIQPG